jgi:hypothetical protein
MDEGKEQWDELAAILGCDGDNVDLVLRTAKRIMSDRIAPITEPAQEQPGWKLVPVEPTMEMCEAMMKASDEDDGLGPRAVEMMDMYMSALATSPTPPKEN